MMKIIFFELLLQLLVLVSLLLHLIILEVISPKKKKRVSDK